MNVTIDLALALYLVFVIPCTQLWRSLRPKDGPKRPRSRRYLSTIREIALLLLALAAVCWWNGHTASDLGVAAPTSGAAFWSLLIAVAALPAAHFIGKIYERRTDPAKHAASQRQLLDNDMLPRTAAELRLFVAVSLFIGIGWELLYRGFLMLALTPWLGTWGALLAAAVAYGAAHGYQSAGMFAGSIVSALLFTGGYALTGSLWWLMLIHVALPLAAPLYYYKIMRDEAARASAGGSEQAIRRAAAIESRPGM